jgi:formylmethanofuran dehydrogenase subunit E
MAATFVNLETGVAFRIASTEKSRELAGCYASMIQDKRLQQLAAYRVMPLEELFVVERVTVDVPASELPGPSRCKAVCEQCGTVVRDRKEVHRKGRILCQPCAFGGYYRRCREDATIEANRLYDYCTGAKVLTRFLPLDEGG